MHFRVGLAKCQYMRVLAECLWALIRLGCGSIYLFSVAVQTWYKLLKQKEKNVVDFFREEEVLILDDPLAQKPKCSRCMLGHFSLVGPLTTTISNNE